MSPTVRHRLDDLWSVGARFLADNRLLLHRHLTDWLDRLSDDASPPWSDPLFRKKMAQLTDWFLTSIPSFTHMDRRTFAQIVGEQWRTRFSDGWSAKECILSLSILERVVFQALHSVGHARQQQALHYWFFNLVQAVWPPTQGAEDPSEMTVIPFPLKQETWLFATDTTSSPYVNPVLSLAQRLHRNHDLKDSLILFGQSLTQAKNLQETLERIAAGFVQYLPFKRVALFAYSSTDDTGIGMYGYQYNHHAVRKIRLRIPDIPLYRERERHHQPIYVPDAARGIPPRYVKQFQLQSMVIAPFYLASKNTVLGAAVLDQGEDKPFELSAETWTTLLKLSQWAAEALSKYWKNGQLLGTPSPNVSLSPRERDVLQLMADGLSMSEAAQELSISEFTVRDYVLSAMRKLNANNRTQAVAMALRMGLIS